MKKEGIGILWKCPFCEKEITGIEPGPKVKWGLHEIECSECHHIVHYEAGSVKIVDRWIAFDGKKFNSKGSCYRYEYEKRITPEIEKAFYNRIKRIHLTDSTYNCIALAEDEIELFKIYAALEEDIPSGIICFQIGEAPMSVDDVIQSIRTKIKHLEEDIEKLRNI